MQRYLYPAAFVVVQLEFISYLKILYMRSIYAFGSKGLKRITLQYVLLYLIESIKTLTNLQQNLNLLKFKLTLNHKLNNCNNFMTPKRKKDTFFILCSACSFSLIFSWQVSLLLKYFFMKYTVCSGPQQTSKMESFATIVNGFMTLNIVAKLSTLDACGGPGYEAF